jgi:hypothetical protein
VRAYRIDGKSQSKWIDYRYRHTHTGTLSLIIFVDRIDLILLVAVTYDTPILCHSHATRMRRKYLAMSNIVHLQKIEDLLNVSLGIRVFESTILHFNDYILSVYLNKFCSITLESICQLQSLY